MKKRSGASSSSRPPEAPTLFLDRSLGNKVVASALREQGVTVEIHSDHFPPDAEDRDWLARVGDRGWIVLTKDRRIRYRALERSALVRANVRAFVLTSGEMTGPEMAETFVKALPAMVRLASATDPPFIAKIARGGAVHVMWPEAPRRPRKHS